jgi:hypothetical protein
MATGYEPNIEGALAVIVDLMIGEGVPMARDPYAPNFRGLVDALIDLKEGFPTRSAGSFEISLIAGENISQGQVVYIDVSDGEVYKAIASGTVDEATVLGFAKENKNAGQVISIQVGGILSLSGLDEGEIYFLSAVSAGSITLTPPSTAGQFVTRVGEAGSTAQMCIKPEVPILLS